MKHAIITRRIFAMTKMFSICILVCSLTSCIEVKEHIILNKDGSGKVVIEVQADSSLEQYASMFGGSPFDAALFAYPPVTEKSLRMLFPGETFTIEVKDIQEKKFAMGIAAEIAFTDINDLLASPYGNAKSLEVTRDEDRLRVRARTGLEPVVFSLTTEEPGNMRFMGGLLAALLEQNAQKKSDLLIEFRLTLPEEPLEGNGKVTDRSAVWTLDYANLQDDERLRQEAMKIMTVSCVSTDMTFSPNTPPRLALDNFDQLHERKIAGEEIPSRDEIINAIKFSPYKMVIKRSFDISGEGYGDMENYGYLTGVIKIPQQLAPPKWGEETLLEITDDLGNSLMPSDKDESYSYRRYSRRVMYELQRSEQDEYKQQQPVSFFFNAPDRDAQAIASFKGEIEVTYFSGSQVVKLDKTIKKDSILDMEPLVKEETRTVPDFKERKLDHPKLSDVGLNLILERVMAWGDNLMIYLSSEEDGSLISQVQVFDEQGKPWPTVYLSGTEEEMAYIMVLGELEPPLSLAFLVSGSGSSVKVPIELSDISLRKNYKD